LMMILTIVAYDQLLFRPLVAWADKFRAEQTAAQVAPRSLVLDLFAGSGVMAGILRPASGLFSRATRANLRLPALAPALHGLRPPSWLIDTVWFAAIAAIAVYAASVLFHFVAGSLGWPDVVEAVGDGLITLVRVIALIALATLIWVPVGVAVGLNPVLAEKVQPVAQFLAAFPANLMFPIAVVGIVHFRLPPNIWLSPLMILGTQWYILFNVIAGASAFPTDFREAASVFHIRGWRWWREVMLPGVFPYFVTGAITASGGAWNASIVSEAVSWGSTRLSAVGLGSYIARMTDAGDFPRITLGVGVMSIMVIAMNRLLWRPLYAFAEKRTRLD
jgi:NitT/TauT family transport system permease protein